MSLYSDKYPKLSTERLFSFFSTRYIDLPSEVGKIIQYFLVVTRQKCSCGAFLILESIPVCFYGCSISPKCERCVTELDYIDRYCLKKSNCRDCSDKINRYMHYGYFKLEKKNYNLYIDAILMSHKKYYDMSIKQYYDMVAIFKLIHRLARTPYII